MRLIFRNLVTTVRKFRLASALNLLGLSVAFAAFLVVLMQVDYEYNYGKHESKGKNVYFLDLVAGDGSEEVTVAPFGLAQDFKNSSSKIKAVSREDSYFSLNGINIKVENNGELNGFKEKVFRVDSDYFDMFNFDIIYGDEKSIEKPKIAIIPKSMAEKFFGDSSSAIGKLISIESGISLADLTVGAVFNDFPENSHIKNVIYYKTNITDDLWDTFRYKMYVCLDDDVVDYKEIEDNYNNSDNGIKKVDFMNTPKIKLTPVNDLYLTPFTGAVVFGAAMVDKGDTTTIYVILAIALLVIFISAFNFVNFSVSLAPMRMKSINTYKVLGSSDISLRVSLVAESLIMSFVAWVLSLGIVFILGSSSFSDVISPGISLRSSGGLVFISFIAAMITGLISGMYPAVYTTSFSPVMVLKGSFATSKKGKMLRMWLLWIQFVISTSLIIVTIFIYMQGRYISNSKMELDTAKMLYLSIDGSLISSNKAFEAELRSNSSIVDVGYSKLLLGASNLQSSNVIDKGTEKISFDTEFVSWNLPQMFGLTITDGPGFLEKADTLSKTVYLFNESAKKTYNLELGTTIDRGQSEIAGFMKDFNYRSLHSEISPFALIVQDISNGAMGICYVKYSGDAKAAMEHVKKSVQKIDSSYPLDIHFYDEAFDELYEQDNNTTRIVSIFSFLAIVISLVGVFGLAIFETQYRRKEIAVRKVNGATAMSIVEMINRKFIMVVTFSFVVAVPLAFVIVEKWLESFAYKTPVYVWVFFAGAVIVFIVTVVTVTIQATRTATENPVKYIRNE